MDDVTRTRTEAATFRRLVEHLMEKRPDVQNIDMMNLTGFCRNCLSRWYQEAAAELGSQIDKDAAREIVYGMPYEDWKTQHQDAATAEQKAAFDVAFRENVGERRDKCDAVLVTRKTLQCRIR